MQSIITVPASDGMLTRGSAQHSVKLSEESYVSTSMDDCQLNTLLWHGSTKVSSYTLRAILAKHYLACSMQPLHMHMIIVSLKMIIHVMIMT